MVCETEADPTLKFHAFLCLLGLFFTYKHINSKFCGFRKAQMRLREESLESGNEIYLTHIMFNELANNIS